MLALGPTPPLDDATTHHLEALVRSGATPQRVAQRCRVVLMAAAGVSNRAIAQHLALSRPTVIATRQALGVRGVEALTGKQKRRRARPTLTAELEQRILDTTLKTRPSDGTPGSVRVLAKQLAVSRMMVHRVWQRFDIQPHRVERFRLSKAPRFEDKVRDVVGLYLNPVAESGRTVLRPDYRPHDSTRDRSHCGRAGTRDLPLDAALESHADTVRVESDGRRHPRQGTPV